MLKHRTLKPAFALVICFAVLAAPAYANPGNGNGNGNGNGAHGGKGQHHVKSEDEHGNRKNYGKPDRVGSDINFSPARSLAVNYGLTGYESLPPGIAKKSLPASMINDLPYCPGYEWRAIGDDLVLIALSTAVVTAVINGVFD